MSELHILNVGRADCSVLLLDTERGRRTVVIDGGGLQFQGEEPLLSFLEARDIQTVDVLILTHLHQDHFAGFHQLIDRVAVTETVAPCGDLVFAEPVYPLFGDREYYREYHEIFSYFRQIGTHLRNAAECAGTVYTFGDCVLKNLYPLPDSPQRSVAAAKALCRPDLSAEEIADLLEEHKEFCNADSSIWLLERAGEAIALFAGDSTDQTLRQALAHGGPVHPTVQKLSHHGIDRRYFSQEVQSGIKPKILVVSVDKNHYNETMERVVDGLALAGGSEVYYTFQGNFTHCF